MSALSMMSPAVSSGKIAHFLKVDRLMDIAFFPGRTERSPEYLEGCRAALEFHLVGRRIRTQYGAGCAAADAFFAGAEEGHGIWRRESRGAVQ